MRIFLFVVFIFSLALQGCTKMPFSKPREMVGALLVDERSIIPQGGYILNTGDRIRIVVFGQDSLSNAYQIDSIGNISMPLIGQIEIAGKTTKQAELAISTKLKDGYVREPHIAIEVETYRPFFIMGEITQSGQYPYVYGMTAQTAIAIAGGYTPRAKKTSLEVTRRVNGQLMRAEVPVTHVIQPGDTLAVHERWF